MMMCDLNASVSKKLFDLDFNSRYVQSIFDVKMKIDFKGMWLCAGWLGFEMMSDDPK